MIAKGRPLPSATIPGGGTAHYVAAWLTTATGGALVPAGYVIVGSLIALITLGTMQETARVPLES